MTIEIVIPEKYIKDRSTKDLVFSILSEEESKTLTQLHREIKRRYRISVTFQAVIKAVSSLLSHQIIIKEGKLYSLNKEWVFETRNFFDKLYTDQFKVKKPMKKIELGKDVTIYTVNNLLELDRLWNDLLTNWAKKETEDKRNVWKGRHCWWLIPRLQEEDILHDFFTKQKIKTYNLLTSNKVLDKIAVSYYRNRKEHIRTNSKLRLKSDSHISAFGEVLVKFEIPTEISSKLEKIYQKTKRLEDLDLKKVLDIFKQNTEIEITVIEDRLIADNIKKEISNNFN